MKYQLEEQKSVQTLLSYISEERLNFLAEETAVNWNAKKLTGQELLKLCLYGVLSDDRASTRVFESYYQDTFFRSYAGVPSDKQVRHSSIAERIGKIKVSYFQQLYEHTLSVFKAKLPKKDRLGLSLYDSTITSLSSSLLAFGMQNGQKNKEGKQGKHSIKFTVGFNGLPFKVDFHKEQKMISEDLALGDILKEHLADPKDIAVFDRGLRNRKKWAGLAENGQYFVTRLRKTAQYTLVEGHQAKALDYESDSLRLVQEKRVYLYCKQQKTKVSFRLIEGVLKESQENILFLSNLDEKDFTAEQLAAIYKKRWEIESFFRFIKQELNFKHFFSRNWNGIQVMVYIILMAAILLLVYIKLNHLKGYKIPKRLFCKQLQTEIIKDIVIHCGGNPEKIGNFKI